MIARVLFVATLSLILLAQSTFADEVDDFVQQEMRQRGIPGTAIVVVRDAKPLKVQGYGAANLTTKEPVTNSTKFQLASVTKQFTATAVMLLVEEQRMTLDAPIGKYLSGAPAAWKNISIRNLLTHTSGIPEYFRLPESARCKNAEDIFSLTSKSPLRFQPGAAYAYSNTNYVLLGLAIEQVIGKTYDELLADRRFRPLDMQSTGRRAIGDPKVAIGYVAFNWRNLLDVLRRGLGAPVRISQGAAYLEAPFLDPGLVDNADGGLVTTAEDMKKWAVALHTGNMLERSSLEQMWSKTKLTTGKTQDYGFGVGVNDYRGGRIIGHSGGRPGVVANLTTFVDSTGHMLSVAVLCNVSLSGEPGFDIGFGIVRLLDARWR